eukprot:CAMPEP_0204538974 /NCGR_PEP_ID=MMETSP0661-20131031/16396_1 /ASSEMBLY_ACC=CAM_ASM_000606 /TAXON_ID=109239 /ORGANISM="Alexandrium margalefi, Strain AMGDE01CS-322" /LENGTH=164 /DNA_ID=CAMNT_0051545573 /DNA_START=17 /DNA_END=508 /DNA_ORIENTATION=+
MSRPCAACGRGGPSLLLHPRGPVLPRCTGIPRSPDEAESEVAAEVGVLQLEVEDDASERKGEVVPKVGTQHTAQHPQRLVALPAERKADEGEDGELRHDVDDEVAEQLQEAAIHAVGLARDELVELLSWTELERHHDDYELDRHSELHKLAQQEHADEADAAPV